VPQLGLLVGTCALLVLGLLPERTLGRSRGFAGAAALLVWTGSLTFVFADDTYVGDGSSRWSSRGSSEHEAFVAVAATTLLAPLCSW